MKNVTKPFGIGALALAMFAGSTVQGVGGQIPTRADLNAILGGSGVTETFEGFNIANNEAVLLDGTTLNSSTVTNGQGPGLVVPGFTISDALDLQWNGNGYFGLSTKSVSGGYGPISVSFSSPTTAFGVDLETYGGGNATVVTATVYARDDSTVIGTVSNISIPGPSPVFFGWQDAGGIGQVIFTNPLSPFSPVLDNLTFGTASVPEPSSIVAVGIAVLFGSGGALRRRRKSIAA